ncbi:MAG TPA: hypothetical protein PLZ65_05870, partial [Limnochordia bacterium]|nr:hypothetical protein [Limnochordia bacterium]HPU64899.1 hypothetical protein [Limnochordia bacterium]
MFVRIVKAKDKKYAQVVESFRNGKQVSHRVLWSLGRYDEPLARSVFDLEPGLAGFLFSNADQQ